MASRLLALDPACIYFCPSPPSHRAKQSVSAVQVRPKPTPLSGFGVFSHNLLRTGGDARAGAAAHPVPQKYSSVEDERQLPALGGEEIGKCSYKCDSYDITPACTLHYPNLLGCRRCSQLFWYMAFNFLPPIVHYFPTKIL